MNKIYINNILTDKKKSGATSCSALISEAHADGMSGVISGLSFAQTSKKPKLDTSDFQKKRQSQIYGKQAAMKNKFNAMRRKRIAEALAYGERDPTQRRVRSGQDNTPSTEVGVKGSQSVPTRDLNDESGNNKKIKNQKYMMPGDKQLISTNCGMESGNKKRIVPSIENNQESGKKYKKIKEDYIDEGLMSWLKKRFSNLFHRPELPPENIKDSKKEYVWRTQQDDKVRDLHNELEGKQFSFDDPPISGTSGFRGNPGEPANCRCYAEPVNSMVQENINIIIEHLDKEGKNPCLYQ